MSLKEKKDSKKRKLYNFGNNSTSGWKRKTIWKSIQKEGLKMLERINKASNGISDHMQLQRKLGAQTHSGFTGQTCGGNRS